MIKAGDKVAPRLAKQLQAEQKTPHIRVSFEQIDGRYAALDIINEKTGEIYVEAGEELIIDYDKDGKIKGGNVMALIEAGVTDVPTLDINADAGPYMRNTMIMDKNYNHETALLDIYRIMRPGEPPALETALDFFNGLFFKPDNYDLSAVGRVKINSRLDMKADASERILSKEDIVGVVKELVDLRDGRGETDDIDHLGNRRVRSVGELMENKQLQAEQKTPHIRVSFEQIDGRYAALDIINEKTGEIYVEAGEELIIDYDKDGKIKGGNVMALIEAGVTDVPTLDINADAGPYMRNTMIMDKNYNHETALLDIYRIMRPGEPPALETALDFFNGLFFKPDNYDLSAVGRVKINSRLDMKADASERILSKEDIVGVVKELVDLRDGRGETDDIDHLGNRRVRSVGELMEIMTPSAINTTKRKTPGFARFSPNESVVRGQRKM